MKPGRPDPTHRRLSERYGSGTKPRSIHHPCATELRRVGVQLIEQRIEFLVRQPQPSVDVGMRLRDNFGLASNPLGSFFRGLNRHPHLPTPATPASAQQPRRHGQRDDVHRIPPAQFRPGRRDMVLDGFRADPEPKRDPLGALPVGEQPQTFKLAKRQPRRRHRCRRADRARSFRRLFHGSILGVFLHIYQDKYDMAARSPAGN